jgi:hypothetical protein
MGNNIMNRTPKVFISYSWTFEKFVIELAERLTSDGIYVVLDKYELKEGQDKYVFMERSVTDPSIDKVLIVSDKSYTEKANSRAGGVSDETQIITPEIFGNTKQEKFIPIVAEKNDDGSPCLPAYIKTRVRIDLSTKENYEDEYEKLLRNIYNKPACTKPQIGKPPDWVNSNTANLTPIKKLLKQLENCNANNTKAQKLAKDFIDEYIAILLPYNRSDIYEKSDSFFKVIDEFKPFRDYYTDFLEIVVKNDMDIPDVVSSFFEKLFNKTHEVESDTYSCNPFEHFDYLIWESFISTIVILLHYGKYKEIHDILSHPYFMKRSFFKNSEIIACGYIEFCKGFERIEMVYKPNSQSPKLYTLAGEMLIKREKKPIITSQKIAEADIMLFQLSGIINFTANRDCHYRW